MRQSSSIQQESGSYDDRPGFERQPQAATAHRGVSRERTRPRRPDIFLHAPKTLKLIGSLVMDRRVPLWSKLLFVGSVGGLLVLLLFPDALNEVVLSTILPLAGTILGVPLDAGFDWVTFALVVVTLLHFFPADLVAEHYSHIFRK